MIRNPQAVRRERASNLTRLAVLPVLAFVILGGLVVAAIAAQQADTVASAKAVNTTKSGAADGARSPALTGARRPLYRLHKSDVVEISFTFSPQFDETVTVQPDGFIALKGAKPLLAEGLSTSELQQAVTAAYEGILHDPEITIALKDFDKPYFIAAGEIGRPGRYDFRDDITVSQAIALAGGFTTRSKHSQIVLFRKVSGDLVESHVLNLKMMLKTRNLQEDMLIEPGDLLFVPQNLISKIRQFMPASSLSLYANSSGL